jgi:hypothetical protein
MESRDQRIATLASTLKTSGIAKSESQARMMAEEMIGVEEHVQKNYEEKHAAAHEYLRTTKNLGDPRVVKLPSDQVHESKSFAEESESKKIAPMDIQSAISRHLQHESAKPEYTDITFGKRTLNQAFSEHDTHNAALESIKAEIQNEEIFPAANEEEKDYVEKDSVDETDAVVDERPLPLDMAIVAPEPVEDEMNVESSAEKEVEEDAGETIKDEAEEEVREEIIEEEKAVKLDTKKLIDMMEEDGKLEEHTRAITEKPSVVKPKEDYEENSIDLSAVFGVHKK